jgi:hypothetical protein
MVNPQLLSGEYRKEDYRHVIKSLGAIIELMKD